MKNSFISLLIDVQNRQKEHRELLRKRKKVRSTTTTGPNGQRTTSTHIPGTVSHRRAGGPAGRNVFYLPAAAQSFARGSSSDDDTVAAFSLQFLAK